MKKIFYLFILLILVFTIGKTQENTIENSDTNSYEYLEKLDDLNQFGYKYEGKKLRIHCYFWRIYNDDLRYTNEGIGKLNKRKLVGFKITDVPFLNMSGETQHNFVTSYGYQKDILDILQNLKQDDEITIFGTVVPINIDDEVGFRVDKVLIGNYDNEGKYSLEKKVEESIFLKWLKNYWFIGLIGLILGIVSNKRKKM